MHIITFRRLREFWEKHPQAERPLRAWFSHVEHARWQNFAEVRNDFASADQVQRLTVFNIAGNHYRLVVRVEYHLQKVFVRAVMTHVEYDRETWKDDEWFE
ncbi:MAG: type II toxin-antitoxin system HigB family toxin [Caldilineaceae bacterium]